MATIDDVEAGLCSALAGLLFSVPSYQFAAVGSCVAPYSAAAGCSVLTIPTRLYIGDPNPTNLDADLAAGIANITIHRNRGFARDTTRFAPHHRTTGRYVPSLQVALGSGQVTFGGTPAAGQVVGVTVGKTCYAYAVQSNDTIPTLIAALAAEIPGATASGAVLTAAGVTQAAVGMRQTGIFVTGQQEAVFTVTVYAPPVATPVAASGFLVRAALGSLVSRLKSLTRPNRSVTRFIGLPDGSSARVLWLDENNNDRVDRANMWIRTISFRVEYDETVSETPMTVLAPIVSGNLNGVRIVWLGNGAPALGVMTDGAGNLLADASGTPIGTMA